MSDMMAVMNQGQFVEYGPADSIYANPTNDYTRRLIEAVPRDTIEQIELRQKQRLEAVTAS